MQVVTTAAGLVVFPMIAGILGGIVAVVGKVPAAAVSGVQHFAAGVVMAAVAGEVLPELRDRGPLWLVVIGFGAGVALLLGMRRFEDRDISTPGALPAGFMVVIGVDLFVDGLLVGAGAAVSRDTAVVIAVALTIEVLFLGMTVGLRLLESGSTKTAAAAITAGLVSLVGVGAVLGGLLLAGAGDNVLALVLAFAAAALLWLVVEELLVEAHETEERPWMAAMFFVGFFALFCLESLT